MLAVVLKIKVFWFFFFFKQKTAYEIGVRLVGSEMCIRDRRYPGKEIVPAGIFYYRIQDPIVAREKTDEKTEESILKELKLDGLVNGEEEVIEHLEANLTGSSLYYPLRRNQNGLLGSASKALPQEKFETVLAYTLSLIHI